MGGVQLRRRLLARGDFRLLPAGDGLRCLAITVDEYWLQHCLTSIHAKIILFHFRRGSMLKYNYFRTVDRQRRLGFKIL